MLEAEGAVVAAWLDALAVCEDAADAAKARLLDTMATLEFR
jgi:hypothetical protein